MKKHAFKRVMAALLAVTLIIGAIPIGAFAEEGARREIPARYPTGDPATMFDPIHEGDTVITGTYIPGTIMTVTLNRGTAPHYYYQVVPGRDRTFRVELDEPISCKVTEVIVNTPPPLFLLPGKARAFRSLLFLKNVPIASIQIFGFLETTDLFKVMPLQAQLFLSPCLTEEFIKQPRVPRVFGVLILAWTIILLRKAQFSFPQNTLIFRAQAQMFVKWIRSLTPIPPEASRLKFSMAVTAALRLTSLMRGIK